jgi:transposase
MMRSSRYSAEFKSEAVKQVLERGYTRKEVAERLGISAQSLYRWIDEYTGGNHVHGNTKQDRDAEIAKLKAENKRLREERDILKKAAAFFAREPE